MWQYFAFTGLVTSGTAAGSVSQTAGTSSVLDSFGGGLVDKYSIIREEASKVMCLNSTVSTCRVLIDAYFVLIDIWVFVVEGRFYIFFFFFCR